MENKYLAKSNEAKSIENHTIDLLKQYDILKKLYSKVLTEEEWEILRYAVIFHDLGKINTKFQNKIYKVLKLNGMEDVNNFEEIPHNFLSHKFIDTDYFIEKFGEELTKILCTSIYYHHNREKKYTREQEEIIGKDLLKQLQGITPFLGIELDYYPNNSDYLINVNSPKGVILIKSKKYIIIKGLLNKLDYTASLDMEGVCVEDKLTDSKGKFIYDYVEEKYSHNLRPVQKYMLENQNENLIVISPTGSGKTEASILWLGKNKSFYTLPLKVSINAMYDRVKNDIGYEYALLLHSDAYSKYIEEYKGDIHNDEYSLQDYNRAKRLSSPFTITTVDQIFKIIFKYPGYEEILSTFSYSKILIDEIQMYSPDLLAYIIIGIKMITDVGGKFAVVTATFPHILYEFFDMLKIEYKRQDLSFKMHISNRHKIQILKNENIDVNEVIKQSKDKKVLVIVNTVKSAQSLYEHLKDYNVYLLHSNFTKAHRKKLEEKIMKFAQNNEPGIWISTQIVEASLDIDFDILFTEMCSIDSLFQRMGRVYRKREYNEINPNVYIYDNRNGAKGTKKFVIDPEIYEFSLEAIIPYNNKNLTEDDKQDIINKVFNSEYNTEIKESRYYKTVKDTIKVFNSIIPYYVESDDVKKRFRDIKTLNLIPDSIFNKLYENETIEIWSEELKNSKSISKRQKIKDEINKFVVSVTYRPYLDYESTEEIYENSNIYRTLYKYEFDEEKLKGKGLIISREEAKDDSFI